MVTGLQTLCFEVTALPSVDHFSLPSMILHACFARKERALKLTKALLTQFHVSAFRFLDKVERAKVCHAFISLFNPYSQGVSRVPALSTAKHEVGQPFGAGIGMTTLIGK